MLTAQLKDLQEQLQAEQQHSEEVEASAQEWREQLEQAQEQLVQVQDQADEDLATLQQHVDELEAELQQQKEHQDQQEGADPMDVLRQQVQRLEHQLADAARSKLDLESDLADLRSEHDLVVMEVELLRGETQRARQLDAETHLEVQRSLSVGSGASMGLGSATRDVQVQSELREKQQQLDELRQQYDQLLARVGAAGEQVGRDRGSGSGSEGAEPQSRAARASSSGVGGRSRGRSRGRASFSGGDNADGLKARVAELEAELEATQQLMQEVRDTNGQMETSMEELQVGMLLVS